MKAAAIGLAAGLAFALPGAVRASDIAADKRFTDTSVGFDLKGTYSNVTLTISGPRDFHASAFARAGAPVIDLRRYGELEDGLYTYQLTAATAERARTRTRLDDGRAASAPIEPLQSAALSGTFRVQNGAIVKPDGKEPSRRDQK
jgi:hypothetical protein